MRRGVVQVEGELFLTLEVVAELYHVRVVVLEEAVAAGLLATGAEPRTRLCIAAVHLDRVATIVRLHETLGLDFESIEHALGD